MMARMKQRLLSIGLGLIALLLVPAMAMAQSDDSLEPVDARLEGYATSVTLESESNALTWLLLTFLAVVCLSVLFKDAKRTHLD